MALSDGIRALRKRLSYDQDKGLRLDLSKNPERHPCVVVEIFKGSLQEWHEVMDEFEIDRPVYRLKHVIGKKHKLHYCCDSKAHAQTLLHRMQKIADQAGFWFERGNKGLHIEQHTPHPDEHTW